MSNFISVKRAVVLGSIIGCLIGVVAGVFAGKDTSVLLPGLGLIIAGELLFGVFSGFVGIIVGSLLGLTLAKLINKRRSDYL